MNTKSEEGDLAAASEPRLCVIDVRLAGGPVVNSAMELRRGPGVVAISVDLRTKYCEVEACCGGSEEPPSIYIGATGRSLRADHEPERTGSTEIIFPEFVGWSVWAAEVSRYTLAVCLIKHEAP